MASDLTRGAYSGKETKLYYNSASHATPTWVEIVRARNIQINRGPALGDVEFHGGQSSTSVPGYAKFNGSFEYVRRRGVDAVYNALITARDNQAILHVRHLNGPIVTVGVTGIDAPIMLGEGSSSVNGGDAVAESFNFGLADAFNAAGVQINVTNITIA